MYIPPNGIFFRLIDRESQLVIYSNDNKNPPVFAVPPSNSSDQLFTLIHGTGDRKGLFAIKGSVSGKVLFSRAESDPKVGHVGGDGKDDDNWFKFVEGSGPESGSFRIVCPATNTELYASTRLSPIFGNLPFVVDNDDVAWNFRFENNLSITDVAFDLAAGGIDGAHVVTLFSQSFTNNSAVPVEHTFLIKGSYQDTSLFAFGSGFPIPTGKQFESFIPVVSSDGKIGLSATKFVTQFATNSFSINHFHAQVTVTVPPHKTATAKAVSQEGNVEVPFTITLTAPNGTTTETKGEWVGDLHWNVTFPVDIA
ncbi:hypothetical protein C8Q77DRAFT_1258155 [Trametes polyzona]|nr:hypothetical protein C8Q77DRAFT_1258155 [Trametes polyzona]